MTVCEMCSEQYSAHDEGQLLKCLRLANANIRSVKSHMEALAYD